jgi:hypothetical protein
MNGTETKEQSAERAPTVDDSLGIAEELAKFESAERERLGLPLGSDEHWSDRAVNVFTKEQRANTTVLLSGLSIAQDMFLQAALQGVGYNTLSLDCPDNDALRLGKEFGNRGQCNPTYFTVGNLIKFLQHLQQDKKLSKEEIVEKYLFITAGGCGPCRFSMYITEYRKALRDCGFDGFRVLVASQTDGVQQAIGRGAGLDVNLRLFLAVMKALVMSPVPPTRR